MKGFNRILCGGLAAALLLSLTACTAGGDTAAEPTPVPAVKAPAATAAPKARTESADPDAADKEETVYVQAEPDGSVQKITVETILNYGGDGGDIRDATNLTDIKNTEGDEEFTLGKNGALTWEDHGERIRYEGVSAQELPVTVRLTYWLDEKETAPADLAGQSGHVRVRFDYDNHTGETVTVTHADLSGEDDEAPEPPETEEVEIPIPFLAISLAMLPEDVFQNVRVENGRLMSLGDSAVVLGYAFPGLSEALDLTACELTEDVEIPDYVEFQADVTDFSLDFTATIVSNGLLDELEPEDLDDIEKLTDGMDKLTEASEKLVDGAKELSDGAGDFAYYLDQYVSGVSQVGSGADAVSAGLSAISGQTGPLREGADAAAAQLAELRNTLNSLDIPELDDTAAALEAVIAAIDSFQTELMALQSYPAAVESVVAAADSALSGADLDVSSALDGLDLELTEEQRQEILAAVAGELGGARSAIDEARAYLGEIPSPGSDPQLSAYAVTLSETAAQLREQAQQALDAADSLPASPNAALDELSGLVTGVSALCDAIDQLAEGSSALTAGVSALTDSGSSLREAAYALADGADALADGLKEFDEEGIAELADLADRSLADLVTRIRALREADLSYDNFGGIAGGRTGSVRFIIETDTIE